MMARDALCDRPEPPDDSEPAMPADATQRPRLVFAHANGFRRYRSLLDPLAESFDVHLLDRWATTDYPVNHNWGNGRGAAEYLPDTDALWGWAFTGRHADGHGCRRLLELEQVIMLTRR